jgi:HAD superfamily hydrolase (TIGR01509 family)
MIKLVVFDFDGVLAALKEAHYVALNKALEFVGKEYVITLEEHISTFDGLSTKKKLDMLVKLKNFPAERVLEVFDKKQEFTLDAIEETLKYDGKLYDLLVSLRNRGVLTCVASNAIRATLEAGLKKLGVFELFNLIVSNEDVKNQKPNPEIYLYTMAKFGVSPKETIICEDSKHGRESAVLSGAHIFDVDSPEDLKQELLESMISRLNDKKDQVKWSAKNTLTVLIPMGGRGSRFANVGYQLPKPLINVCGKPMIQRVIENLNIDAEYIFLCRDEHVDTYLLKYLLPAMVPGCKVLSESGNNGGPASACLTIREHLDNDKHLLIANSDQIVEWNPSDFCYFAESNNVDGCIQTFTATGTKWSYVKLDENENVIEVAEKKEISNIATTGLYYFNKGSDYIRAVEKMVAAEDKVNGEYYIAPCYNYMIAEGAKIKRYNCEKMHGIGVPDDLNNYIKNVLKDEV